MPGRRLLALGAVTVVYVVEKIYHFNSRFLLRGLQFDPFS